jgi:hypothetical protein
MVSDSIDPLRLSEPAFAGLEVVPQTTPEGCYSDSLQVWIIDGRPSALSELAHMKSVTKTGGED